VEPIGLDDILGYDRYGAERVAIRQRIIEHKRARRVAVGERLSFLFEDRATVWYQIQEMLWVEHITDLDAIRAELETYNPLLPGPREFSTTLLIEIEDQGRIREELNRLIGIDEHVTLEVGEARRIAGVFEAGRQTEEKLAAVQFVRFPLDAEAAGLIEHGARLALVVAHPHYRARAVLPETVRARLAADLSGAAGAGGALAEVRDGR
jgi:hypothetical protein